MIDKKKQMQFNINNFLLAVTDILDAKDCENNGVTKKHSLRVAFVSLKIANKMNFEPKELFDLCAYALFHNYIDEDKLKILNIKNDANKLSTLIDFVHLIDQNFNFAYEHISNRESIKKFLKLNKQTQYSDVLLEDCSCLEFWLDCQSPNVMLQYIYGTLHDFTSVYDFEKVLEITTMFGELYEDLTQLLKLSNLICDYYKFEHKDKQTFLIACSLMNFGKLAIPSFIIEKKGGLSEEEYELLKSNVYYLKNGLINVYGFNDICSWASRHHESLNGKGYPSCLSAKDLSLKDRLISIINIVNASLSHRSYRDKLDMAQTIKIIHKKANNGEIDKALVEDLEHLILDFI